MTNKYNYIVDGLITINKHGNITQLNHKAEQIFGYQESEVLGKNVSLLMPSPYAEHHDQYLKRYFKTGQKRLIGVTRQLKGKRKDGSVFPLEISLGELPYEGDDEPVFLAVIRDISNVRMMSRYEKDFEQLEKLGSGAFGTVFKVRNRLDGQFYAVKKIRMSRSMMFLESLSSGESSSESGSSPLLEKTDNDNLSKRDREKLREASILATITSHPNVVRYYTSWMEAVPFEKLDPNMIEDSTSSDEDDEEEYSQLETDISREKRDFIKSQGSSKSNDSRGSNDGMALVLYIQMQLCESSTLKQWLENPDRKVDSDTNLLIFAQIVRGLDHIHNSGYMHRDLKPSNIFISNDKSVKIGDFGLAKGINTKESVKDIQTEPSQSSSPKIMTKEKPLERKLTMGVGTAIYAAPEQLTSRDYGRKADIYALGVILAEMYCQPFRTSMERSITLAKIRSGKLPDPIEKRHSKVAALIKKLLHKDPNQRPTCSEILKEKLLEPALTKLHDLLYHLDITNQCGEGCAACKKQNVIITKLMKELRQKDEAVKKLKQEIEELKKIQEQKQITSDLLNVF